LECCPVTSSRFVICIICIFNEYYLFAGLIAIILIKSKRQNSYKLSENELGFVKFKKLIILNKY